MVNIDLFKENIWKSYFKINQSLYDDVLSKYQQVRTRRKEIEESARQERTQWERAIDLFNDRFFVPFRLEAKNKTAVALGHETMLDLGYSFKDNGNAAAVVRETLLKVLSQGEKKALYILNIIFEIEVRRQNKIETLFVVDDIADSFDYKNKYAIIQYLHEISEDPLFKLVLLTHNFDFFRTVNSRNVVPYSQCLMAFKSPKGITLERAAGIENVFINDWKKEFFKDKRKKIASIAFMRNLIEYTHGETDPDYLKLTSLVHWKAGSESITQGEIDKIYTNLFGGNGAASNDDPKKAVVDMIHEEAKGCLKVGAGVNFEHKVVLSIAIRLAAEKFMVEKIGDPTFVAAIEKNQTYSLLKKLKQLNVVGAEAIKTLEAVVLMTPENIHLNSFMYEPILDMSDDHLKELYRQVLDLK